MIIGEHKPNEYNTEDYGTIYRNTLTSTLEKLGVKTKRQNSFVKLIFDKKKIRKTAGQYGFAIQERINNEINSSERSERSEGSLHTETKKGSIENENITELQPKNNTESAKNCSNSTENDENSCMNKTRDSNEGDDPTGSVHSVHSDHPATSDILKSNLYRIGKTDIIGCRDCKMKSDRWFMNKHPCSGNLQTR
jgi:hypothetical protein